MSLEEQNDIKILLGQVLGRLDAVTSTLTELKSTVEAQVNIRHAHDLRIAALEATRCPKPGMCVSLSSTVSDLQKEVQTLKEERAAIANQAKGFRLAVVCFWGLIGSGAVFVLIKLLRLAGVQI